MLQGINSSVIAADQIRTALRNGDFVGRLGGDEFLVICPRVVSAAQGMEIARRISSALTTSVEIGSDTVELRASVGVVWTMEALDTDTLIARADNAMYESKRLGEHGVTCSRTPIWTVSVPLTGHDTVAPAPRQREGPEGVR